MRFFSRSRCRRVCVSDVISYNGELDWYCDAAGGFTATIGRSNVSFCAVPYRQYICNTCYGYCNSGSCSYRPMSMRGCNGYETNQPPLSPPLAPSSPPSPPSPPPRPPRPPPVPPIQPCLAGTQRGSVTLAGGSARHCVGGQLGILAGQSLTILAGATVFFAPGASIVIKAGSLSVLGTALQPVTFLPFPGGAGGAATGAASPAIVFQGGVDYSTVVLQNAVWRDLPVAVADSNSGGSNTNAVPNATNLSFVNTVATLVLGSNASSLTFVNTAATIAIGNNASSLAFTNATVTLSGAQFTSNVTLTDSAIQWDLLQSASAHIGWTLVRSQVTLQRSDSYYWLEASASVSFLRLTESVLRFRDGVICRFYDQPEWVTLSDVTALRSAIYIGWWPNPSTVDWWSAKQSYPWRRAEFVIANSSLVNSSVASYCQFVLSNCTVSGFGPAGFQVSSAVVLDSTITGAGGGGGGGASTALAVGGRLIMQRSAVRGAATMLALTGAEATARVTSSSLSSTVAFSASNLSAAGPPFVVSSASAVYSNLSGNAWAPAGLMAAVGRDPLTGSPLYRLSNFVWDVFKNISLGEVGFLPFGPSA